MAIKGKTPKEKSTSSRETPTQNVSMTSEEETLANLDEDFGPNGNYALTYNNGRIFLNDKNGVEQFVFINSDGDYHIGTAEDVRARYLAEARAKGGLEAFRKRLFDSGFISEGEYRSKDNTALNSGIIDLARSAAQDLYGAWESRTAWTTPLNSWLSSKSYGTEQAPRATTVETSRQQANQDINNFFMETVGFRPTQAQRDEYYQKLRAAEKKAFRKGVVKDGVEVIKDTLLDEEDIFNIRAEILTPVVKNTPLEKLTSGGGRIAQNVNQLKQYAAQYGINLSTQDALAKVTGQLKKGALRDLSQQETQIREMSKAFYTNISDLIDKGVTVEDIGKQFANRKAQLLGVPEASISIFDSDIQAALRNSGEDGASRGPGVMTEDMFERRVRKDPLFAKSETAKREAYSYVNAITRMFGLTT